MTAERDNLLERVTTATEITKLYDTYRGAFIAYIIKCVPKIEPVAVDIYQESFLAFYRNVKEGKLTELKTSIKTYLFAIGRNMSLNYVRNSKYEIIGDIFPEEPAVEDNLHDEKEIKYEMAYKTISEIGEPCNRILRMYYLEDKSMQEIADTMNYATSQVAKNKKHSCMEKVKLHLKNMISG